MVKKFRLQDREGHDVMGGALELGNPYIDGGYGALISGKPPAQLEVDEFCVKEYALSGQKPTRYTIVRIQ